MDVEKRKIYIYKKHPDIGMQSTTRGEPDKPEMDQYGQDGEIYPSTHTQLYSDRNSNAK